MSFRIILLGLALLAGCDGEFCKRRMEIVPGMVWEYYSQWHSRVVSDKYGIIADGYVQLTFYEYGFDIIGNVRDCSESGRWVYVDLVRNVLDGREETHMSLIGCKIFSSYDAGTAMGMFTKEPHLQYLAYMEALKTRVAKKFMQEGVRRL